MRSFKELRNGKADSQSFSICDGHCLIAKGGLVKVDGPGGAVLFEKAEEIEENKVSTDMRLCLLGSTTLLFLALLLC